MVQSFTPVESMTIIRHRGMIMFTSQAEVADLNIVGALGFGIVSNEAFAAGVGSIPEPFTDSDWGGWMVWRSFAYHFEFQDATGVNYARWDMEIDSKAMRKIGPNEVLVHIVESQTGAFNLAAPIRALVKLA